MYVEPSLFQEGTFADESTFSTELKKKLRIFGGKNEDGSSFKMDFIVCLGGDGTLLYVNSLFQVKLLFPTSQFLLIVLLFRALSLL